ncbi:hypothetical protein [Rhodococcus sp. NBC_00297]|uniref:hypothetical protein n=1 Tax=Rhodococcus sp. NBC_00297 TaxID=2976005 RepID=UPI002E2C9F0A|nr:hypothetical protein [Rhodococcus sp. NBC_00297]
MTVNKIGFLATPFLDRALRHPRLAEMLGHLPAYSAASRVNVAANDALTDLAATVAEAEAAEQGRDLYESGEIPPGFFTGLADKVRAAADARATLEQCNLIVNDSAARMEYAAEHGADAMLAELDSDLQALMSEVRTIVGRLNGATTAMGAMDRGVATDWMELRALRDRYTELREAQASIWNSGRFDPSWFDARRSNGADANETDSLLFIANHLDLRVPDCDLDAFLVWAVSNKAHLWIPTRAQAATVKAAQSERAHLMGVVDSEMRGARDMDRVQALEDRAQAVMASAIARVLGEDVTGDE